MHCGGDGQVQQFSPKCNLKVEDRSTPYPHSCLLSSVAKISEYNSPNKSSHNNSCLERSNHMLEHTISCFEQVQLLSPKCNNKIKNKSVPYIQGHLLLSAAKILQHNSPNKSNPYPLKFKKCHLILKMMHQLY